jgi:hypothetical protein
MCTLSVIPTNDGCFRLVTNRDELLTRPAGEPPQRQALGPRRAAIWPVDPASGGTWVAATDGALVLAMLNANPDPPPAPPDPSVHRSRGLIIPTVVESIDAARAAACLHDMDLTPYQPFRLVAADVMRVVVARWDGAELSLESHGMEPVCVVSSGLGDHLVQEPRLGLWDEMVVNAGTSPATQDAFHAHTWADRPQVSVMMSREDAKTVSRTTVRVRPDVVEMLYEADGEEPVTTTIQRVDAPGDSAHGSAT